MPFASTDPPMERARLVAAHLDGLYSVAELALRFGVSRPTVYKWIERYRESGAEEACKEAVGPPVYEPSERSSRNVRSVGASILVNHPAPRGLRPNNGNATGQGGALQG